MVIRRLSSGLAVFFFSTFDWFRFFHLFCHRCFCTAIFAFAMFADFLKHLYEGVTHKVRMLGGRRGCPEFND